MAKESSSIVPILVVGGIGYYLYSSGFFNSLFGTAQAAVSGGAVPGVPIVPTTLPAIPPATTNQPPVASCPPPGATVNGVCVPNFNKLTSQSMIDKGGNGPFNMDQWCYYYQQVVGLACPVDPGAIPASVYSGAGAVDRTTPIAMSTWLAIMQSQAPSSGISGLGCECSTKDKMLGGLGQILDFGDFFSLGPKRKHLAGNFK